MWKASVISKSRPRHGQGENLTDGAGRRRLSGAPCIACYLPVWGRCRPCQGPLGASSMSSEHLESWIAASGGHMSYYDVGLSPNMGNEPAGGQFTSSILRLSVPVPLHKPWTTCPTLRLLFLGIALSMPVMCPVLTFELRHELRYPIP